MNIWRFVFESLYASMVTRRTVAPISMGVRPADRPKILSLLTETRDCSEARELDAKSRGHGKLAKNGVGNSFPGTAAQVSNSLVT